VTSPIVAVACLTMGAIAWAGDPFPLGPGFRVDEQTGGYYPAYRPDVAAGSQGNFVVSWDGQDATTNYGAFARPLGSSRSLLNGRERRLG
jgi:hypothetical protein